MENTNKNYNDSDEVTLVDFNADEPVQPIEPIETMQPIELDTSHEIEAPDSYPQFDVQPHFEELAPAEPSMGGLISEEVADTAQTTPEEIIISESAPVATETLPALSQSQLALIKTMLTKIEESTKQLNDLLSPYFSNGSEIKIKLAQTDILKTEDQSGGEIIEGVFDGEQMIGPDGEQYSVPANYASKSRLVEGDILKLTISATGAFIYKQIQPIERRRVTGVLEETETGEYLVMAEDRRWHVLSASVTYYKGEPGDQVIIVMPKVGLSKWAAIENIIKR